MTSPPKSSQQSTAPSMNQLAKGSSTTSPAHPPSSSSFTAGPNYNINTASLMGPGPMVGGMAHSQPRMGMGISGVGMGGVGMGYGGYGNPGMMPMYGGGYGMGQQPGMGMGPVGYGGFPPTVGGNQPMGTQQKLL